MLPKSQQSCDRSAGEPHPPSTTTNKGWHKPIVRSIQVYKVCSKHNVHISLVGLDEADTEVFWYLVQSKKNPPTKWLSW